MEVSVVSDYYKELSEQRKQEQAEGGYPEWYSTGGYQMFKEKYLYDAKNFKEQAQRIADTAAKHLKHPELIEDYSKRFFDMLWKGWLSPSTPVLANMGTNRGMPVSCSGTVVEDSISGFYKSLEENAVLTQEGFGTAVYLGDIRPRGSKISRGGKSSGVLPVLEDFVTMSQKVSQGGVRRGSIGQYIPLNHGDFWEIIKKLESDPDSLNIGWNIYDTDLAKLNAGDEELHKRRKEVMRVKMITGKGYFFFPDKVNRHNPQCYKDKGLEVKTSQLCNEITLFADNEHTFTCVLSSLNLARYNEWKDTTTIQDAIVFLDCVVSEFIEQGKKIPSLEKAVRFTEKGRALGLGVCGYHTYLQQESLPFESMEAFLFNNDFFKRMREEADIATGWLAELFGEPEWCKGYGRRNTHCLAIAPTKSTALLMGGVSEGINPDPAMTFTQASAAGDIERVNPTLLQLMKNKGVYNKKNIQQIIDARGSVQGVEWLTDHEKAVFKTAFEINQYSHKRKVTTRGRYIDQWQSWNSFFAAEEDPEYISLFHKDCWMDEECRGMYYVYSKAGVTASKDCESCQ